MFTPKKYFLAEKNHICQFRAVLLETFVKQDIQAVLKIEQRPLFLKNLYKYIIFICQYPFTVGHL